MTSANEDVRTCTNCRFIEHPRPRRDSLRCLLSGIIVSDTMMGCVLHEWWIGSSDVEYAPGYGQRPIGNDDASERE